MVPRKRSWQADQAMAGVEVDHRQHLMGVLRESGHQVVSVSVVPRRNLRETAWRAPVMISSKVASR